MQRRIPLKITRFARQQDDPAHPAGVSRILFFIFLDPTRLVDKSGIWNLLSINFFTNNG
jgi:hypothetical protein